MLLRWPGFIKVGGMERHIWLYTGCASPGLAVERAKPARDDASRQVSAHQQHEVADEREHVQITKHTPLCFRHRARDGDPSRLCLSQRRTRGSMPGLPDPGTGRTLHIAGVWVYSQVLPGRPWWYRAACCVQGDAG